MQLDLTRPYVITVGQRGGRVRQENTRRPCLVDSSATAGYSCVEQRRQQNCARDEAAPTNYVSGRCNRHRDPRHRETPSSWAGAIIGSFALGVSGRSTSLAAGTTLADLPLRSPVRSVSACGEESAPNDPHCYLSPRAHPSHRAGAESRTSNGAAGSLQLQESPVDPALFRRV